MMKPDGTKPRSRGSWISSAERRLTSAAVVSALAWLAACGSDPDVPQSSTTTAVSSSASSGGAGGQGGAASSSSSGGSGGSGGATSSSSGGGTPMVCTPGSTAPCY